MFLKSVAHRFLQSFRSGAAGPIILTYYYILDPPIFLGEFQEISGVLRENLEFWSLGIKSGETPDNLEYLAALISMF